MTSAEPGTPRLSARRSLVEDVYDAIRDLLTSRTIEPGGRATIDHIARSLGVSRTPVREALARLESEGLVTRRPQSGYTVVARGHSSSELFEMRLLIDPYACRTAADRIDSPALGELERLCDDSARAEPLRQRADLDADLHLFIANRAGNPLLVQALVRINDQERQDQRLPGGDGRSVSLEFRELLDAMRDGDSERAERAMINHLMGSHRPVVLGAGPDRR